MAEPGSAQKVTLKLNAVGQALLASERKLTATVSLTAAGKLLQRVSVPLTAPKISATNTHGLGSLARLRLAVPRFAS